MLIEIAYKFALTIVFVLTLTSCLSKKEVNSIGMKVISGNELSAVDIVVSYDPKMASFVGIEVPNKKILAVPHDDGEGQIKIGLVAAENVQGQLVELNFDVTREEIQPELINFQAYDSEAKPINPSADILFGKFDSTLLDYSIEQQLTSFLKIMSQQGLQGGE